MAEPPPRLLNFVSEEQLDQARKNRGERVEDGTAQRDKPLFEILKENKDKRDAEFNERFKHRPPKALDDDETEFLDKLEMSRREYEKQLADEEAEQLRSFHDAVSAQYSFVRELKQVPALKEKKPMGKMNTQSRPISNLITFKPQAKKLKKDIEIKGNSRSLARPPDNNAGQEDLGSQSMGLKGLVSYSDESESEDDERPVTNAREKGP
ncbi:protein FAM192A isoform X2 [Amborella trichopoda]|uniref:protein FAM192A isoform X2 n=1 Tax=Amborella trichopoda TaxID=13333 RepID=UPI0005D2ECF4|nr:protein FAM192A isoform X2 [Amborella trichopoda]|eukprot:XP_011621869.1 protein FAM192A isoform X2 [Amborella trichopoda]